MRLRRGVVGWCSAYLNLITHAGWGRPRGTWTFSLTVCPLSIVTVQILRWPHSSGGSETVLYEQYKEICKQVEWINRTLFMMHEWFSWPDSLVCSFTTPRLRRQFSEWCRARCTIQCTTSLNRAHRYKQKICVNCQSCINGEKVENPHNEQVTEQPQNPSQVVV